ncbi:leucine-rich repeat-containing protein 61-like [Corticium candelabrum]|uniref:leucine-rich repeat-containing protein 61-like n=1 Tax=Corticium candelabrum TaxID=121492 RepID=UPI002E26820B|nr:leucine-rich repeat-containing protein 61-like [Corticium candelabrum]
MSENGKERTTVVTADLLRRESGQFDLAAGILHIELCSRGFQDISVLSQCVGLLRLDLCDNLISGISALAPLTNLQYLNIARNRLETLDGIESMEVLRYLNAAGNSLMSFSGLEPLRGKRELRTIIFHERSQETITNPVCRLPGYQTEVLKLVPQLTVLDGEHLSGPAKELFDLFRELDSKVPGVADAHCSAVSQPEPFLPDGFLDKKLNAKSDLDDEIDKERQQFEVLMNECKKLDKEAATLVLKLQTDDESTTSTEFL